MNSQEFTYKEWLEMTASAYIILAKGEAREIYLKKALMILWQIYSLETQGTSNKKAA